MRSTLSKSDSYSYGVPGSGAMPRTEVLTHHYLFSSLSDRVPFQMHLQDLLSGRLFLSLRKWATLNISLFVQTTTEIGKGTQATCDR